MKQIGNTLLVASALFFGETAFEMYILTALQGPQMLFFSLAHIAPVALVLVFLSAIAFGGLGLFASWVQLKRFRGKIAASSYANFLLVVLCVQLIHVVLMMTYDAWAPALFSHRGI